MMIRERKGAHTDTVLLIRVSWDKDRKRSAQKVLGSFPADADVLPYGLAGPDSPLTGDEKADAGAWIAERAAARKLASLPYVGPRIAQQADELASALEDPAQAQAALKGIDHVAIYAAMDRLARAMRKHKLVRSPVTNKAVETQQAPEVPVVERSQKEGESMSSAA